MAGGTKPITEEQRKRQDMELLIQRPEFLRFLFELIQISGVLAPTTDGSVGRDLAYFEGRRNLGLEILHLVEMGQPRQHPGGLPLLTLYQLIREETLKPTETRNESRSTQYNRSDDLADPEDDDADRA